MAERRALRGRQARHTAITPLYTPGTTAVDLGTTVKTEYGDMSNWSGEVFTDMMGFAHGTPTVKVAFADIKAQQTFFDPQNSYEGIIGLGPSELLETGTTAYMDAAIAAGSPSQLAFELCGNDGKMWIGDFDDTASDPQYTPMLAIDSDKNPFYAVEVDDLALGGTSLGFGSAAFQGPIVDTGTSLFYAPSGVVTALMNMVNASAGRATVFGSSMLSTSGNDPDGVCGGLPALIATGATAAMVDANLPKMEVAFPDGKGGKFTVEADASHSYLADTGTGTFCLVIADDMGDGGVLGDAFLQSFITVIDPKDKKIGFAPEAGCAKAATGASKVRRIAEHGHPFRRRPRAR